jgi:hypothetical protein
MDEVILTANGLLQSGGGAAVSDPLRALGMRVVLGDGYTLRSFMHMLATHQELTRLNDFAPQFVEQLGSWPAHDCAPAGIDRLELARVVELIGHPAPARMEIYHSFRGVTAAEEDVEIKPWRVEALLDVPVRLGRLRHVVFGDRVDAMRFETVCNLFEFLEGICWQLAFHGAPQECALRR